MTRRALDILPALWQVAHGDQQLNVHSMREIPTLQALCLRSIGSHSCSAEATFASKNGQPSMASRLLRSFHERPTSPATENTSSLSAMECIALPRTPCIGPGSSRRFQPNEVDLHHPLTSQRVDNILILKCGSSALDILQSYLDALVELGRMDDSRVGVHFFLEWKANVLMAASRKRRRDAAATPLALGSLSFHNCVMGDATFEAMVEAKMGPNLAILELGGIRSLTDELLDQLLPTCKHLKVLSLKNCRRITHKSLLIVRQHQPSLQVLDVGGCTNLTTTNVLELVPLLSELYHLHASGLGWTDDSMGELTEFREWQSLSLSFSLTLTHKALRQNLLHVSDSLVSLALAFCESVLDNAAMGVLGRNLPHVRSLDVRGNPQLTTVTGWLDGRVSADLPGQALVVLARYTGISEASVEETKRIHPVEAAELVVILDGGGMGVGILEGEDDYYD